MSNTGRQKRSLNRRFASVEAVENSQFDPDRDLGGGISLQNNLSAAAASRKRQAEAQLTRLKSNLKRAETRLRNTDNASNREAVERMKKAVAEQETKVNSFNNPERK